MENVEFDRIYHQTRETFMEAVATRNPKRVHIYKSMPKFVAGDALEKQCMNRLGFDEEKVFKENPVAIYGFSFFGLDGSFHRLSDVGESIDKIIDLEDWIKTIKVPAVEGLVKVVDNERYHIFKSNQKFIDGALLNPEPNLLCIQIFLALLHLSPQRKQDRSTKDFFGAIKDLENPTISSRSNDNGIFRMKFHKGLDNYCLYLSRLPNQIFP